MRPVLPPVKRFLLIILAAFIMAANLNTFVNSGNLLPGGFTGLTLLIQECFLRYLNIQIPFSVIVYILNSIPAIYCFKYLGKRFTLFSCLMILISGLLKDLLPTYSITDDILLSSIFGGILNAISISLCLFADATSGGTDFISMSITAKTGTDSWNYIFYGNCLILLLAGILFGFRRALYSIILQFTSTQFLQILYRHFQQKTLLVISEKPDEIYKTINEVTNHDATIFKGIGCYEKKERTMLYSVVDSDQITKLIPQIRAKDNQAFINVLKSDKIQGRFYRRPRD